MGIPGKLGGSKGEAARGQDAPGRIHCTARRAPGTLAVLVALALAGCTQETQNRISRDIQNWTGTNGVLEIYAGDKLVRRFLKIDKISTATSTGGGADRPYRFGYGVLDENNNGVVDAGERKVYFEISDYGSNYVFYESPR